ncbi:hypothetical protein ASF49_08185 [Methylobacterium sp. Leaf104]|uniref:hypothetical protein n=1 Tax=Methylobacterium TaxID=407 RepID=UPI0006F90502|nr:MULTISPECIES: hypothetical protein [Methylobacterium]KQP33836.1 hypothetical protein ASF49_08185 [Methylobacterium sp. Leaf104]MCI9879596.1 hypothetical protein [Methylobacterium goesingense]
MRLALVPAVAALGLMLGGCPDKAALDLSTRPNLPPVPADLTACFARAFPEIPDRALSRADVVRIIATAKLTDRAKTACGERLLAWASDVQREYGRH